MGSRRKAREAALQVLYGLEFAQLEDADILLELYWSCFATGDEGRDFAAALVQGVVAHKAAIDGIIQDASTNWKLERMALVDRNILRIATLELRFMEDIPKKVSLNEAIEIAKRYGSEDSSSFINGILDRISGGAKKP